MDGSQALPCFLPQGETLPPTLLKLTLLPALRVTPECHYSQRHHAVTAVSKEGFTL